MGCECDPCECGNIDLGSYDEVADGSHWVIRWIMIGAKGAVTGVASWGAGVAGSLIPVPGAGVATAGAVGYIVHDEIGRSRIIIIPSTRESIFAELRNSGIIDPNGRYTGFNDPFAGDPTHMAKQQKSIDELLGGFPSEADLCKCDETSPNAPGIGELPNPIRANNGSPLILDLNNDGVKTIGVEDGVYFDHDGNRFARKSGWVDANDALLVIDKNQNGMIDSGNELFGNNSEYPEGGGKAPNGFYALRQYDSNRDGIVDKNDERWAELKLWQDGNSDGKIDDGELLTLEEAGVAGLNVGYQNQNYTDENGNEHRQIGSFIREDGSAGQMTDVWFATDSIDTEYLDDVEVPDDIKKLPNLKGWGRVRDMHQVMATDETGRLRALVERYIASDPLEGRKLVWDIILAWTGVADIPPDYYTGFKSDSRMLLAVERLTDSRFGVPDDSTATDLSGLINANYPPAERILRRLGKKGQRVFTTLHAVQ